VKNIKTVAIGIRNINTKSGLGKIVLEQIRSYLQKGIAVDIYTTKYDDIAAKSGANFIKIIKIPLVNEYYKRLFFAKSAEKKIAKKKYDLVIGHGDLFQQDVLFLHNLVEKAYELTHQKLMKPLNHLAQIRRDIPARESYQYDLAVLGRLPVQSGRRSDGFRTYRRGYIQSTYANSHPRFQS